MDFFKIKERMMRDKLEIYPEFTNKNVKDLLVRGKTFNAIWNEKKNIWSTDENDVFNVVDDALWLYAKEKYPDNQHIKVRCFEGMDSGIAFKYKQLLNCCPDNYKPMDNKLVYANDILKKSDYATKRLSYDMERGSYTNYEELMNVLYSPEERQKLEWALGAIISGDSKKIQKFIVLYGEPGSGKSTFLNIVEQLFEGYCGTFEAKSLVGSNNVFATEVFKNNPLVAIQHDGDLSRIEDNTKLNSIISHEPMTLNEKFKPSYTAQINCFLFMGTNTPVKITNSKSGIIRRLIDVRPTGNKVSIDRYTKLMENIKFELGAIAHHCLHVYQRLGKNYYNKYQPKDMMYRTDIFFNFIEENYFWLKKEDIVTLDRIWSLYKEYILDMGKQYRMDKPALRDELKSYFREYHRTLEIDGKIMYYVFKGFKGEEIFGEEDKIIQDKTTFLKFELTDSIFDKEFSNQPAQFTKPDGTPMKRWDDVKTTLSNINTNLLHYVKLPENHIVIDFDLKNEDGEKDLELNLREASYFPKTYGELSRSGKGVHLHYIYDGDVSQLSLLQAKDIEIKVFTGNSSLRRKLSFCNNEPIAHISSGLKLKEKKMTSETQIKSESGLRRMVQRNLEKEIHSGTKPSIDFIDKILNDAYNSGMKYDLSDMRNKVLQFAMNSTNQSDYCLKLVNQMKFASKEESESVDIPDGEIVFFDVEVFPNLFVVVYKMAGEDKKPVIMINPSSLDIEHMFKFKLIGFNCRKYDNHILYARYLGQTNKELYNLSQKIIVSKEKGGMFGEAYNISYTDIYDFCSTKQSLKKWEIELGIHHQELGYKWDEDIPEDKWQEVAEYCVNDVIATEKVFNARKADWTARQVLAALANSSVNDTTNQLATKLIFGKEKHPNLVYTDLETIFPGYELRREQDKNGQTRLVNFYRDTDVGFGGYVYAKHGVYYDVALLDVASMHPTSLILLNYFGEYTSKFKDILDTRLAIKHGKFDEARALVGDRFASLLDDESQREALAYALKIVINSQYGLTSSRFDLPQVDKRNVNNIVALRGALFMRTLQDEVTDRGFEVIHIKTDSIKIANATQDIIDFCMKFAESYGYTFEHEATFEKMCLITDADYVGKYKWHASAKKIGKWDATGAQFAHPIVFKTLFTREPIMFEDQCETKSVTSAMYLDMNEHLDAGEHDYVFVGRVGQFCPIIKGAGGGELLREAGEKYNAVAGTKGYRWLESEVVRESNRMLDIDYTYFSKQVDEMYDKINQYTDAEIFCSNNFRLENSDIDGGDDGPALTECGEASCEGCPNLDKDGYHSDCVEGFDNSNYVIGKDEPI